MYFFYYFRLFFALNFFKVLLLQSVSLEKKCVSGWGKEDSFMGIEAALGSIGERSWWQVQGPQHEEHWGCSLSSKGKQLSSDIIKEIEDATVLCHMSSGSLGCLCCCTVAPACSVAHHPSPWNHLKTTSLFSEWLLQSASSHTTG